MPQVPEQTLQPASRPDAAAPCPSPPPMPDLPALQPQRVLQCAGLSPSPTSPSDPSGGAPVSLSFGTINLGGNICHDRFYTALSSLQSALGPLPHFLALSEFRPQGEPTKFVRIALQYGFHLLFDAPDPKGGVGILVSSQIQPQPPPLRILVPGRLIQVDIQLSLDGNFPATSICSFYGSSLSHERASFAPHLQLLLPGNTVLMGDFNCTTQPTDASTVTSNHWNQLRAWELSGQLLDAARILTPQPPYTRTRRYGGTQSYLDRVYLTQIAAQFLTPHSFLVPDMSSSPGLCDHDPLAITFQPWSFKVEPGPRCTFWSHKDKI